MALTRILIMLAQARLISGSSPLGIPPTPSLSPSRILRRMIVTRGLLLILALLHSPSGGLAL